MSPRSLFLGVPLALAIAGGAAAQEARSYRIEPGGRTFTFSTTAEDGDRAVLGISTGSGSARDTLGVLISTVTAGGPAEKAGLEEGSRIASINGVNLKLAAVDVGDWDMSGQMTRRFTREMAKAKAGDEVELKVYSGGQTRTVKVKTVMYDDLYRATRSANRRMDDEDRAALGVSLGSYGSKRDTLGVLLSRVEDSGPAGKAGLEEGNRIQSINGVDLRVGRDDAGDESVSSSKVRRLQREMEKVKAGDEVTLKVYTGGGRTRDLKLKTVPMSDLPRGSGFSIFGTTPMAIPMPARPPVEINLRRMLEEGVLNQNLMENQIRNRLEQVAPAVRRVISNRIII